jgi:hypothetical protein
MTSDEALMLEFQGGSRAAFEELFARYRKPISISTFKTETPVLWASVPRIADDSAVLQQAINQIRAALVNNFETHDPGIY